MESSQPARLGAWLGQVGGKSAPEVKRTSPPGNSTVPSRLAQSRCSSMAWREGGGLGYSQLLPSSVWAGGFHCETLLGPEPRRMCLESCGPRSPGSYSETLARLSPVSEGRVARENKVGWSYMQAARQSHRSRGGTVEKGGEILPLTGSPPLFPLLPGRRHTCMSQERTWSQLWLNRQLSAQPSAHSSRGTRALATLRVVDSFLLF